MMEVDACIGSKNPRQQRATSTLGGPDTTCHPNKRTRASNAPCCPSANNGHEACSPISSHRHMLPRRSDHTLPLVFEGSWKGPGSFSRPNLMASSPTANRLATSVCSSDAASLSRTGKRWSDVTNAVEHCSSRWKRKVSTLLMALLQNTNLEMLLRSSAAVANVGFGEWWRAWRHWARGWTIVAARRPACGNLQGKLHVLREEGHVLQPQTAV